MKRTLYLKFILAYIVFGLLGFLVTSTLGSAMVESRLEKNISENLYREANSIASDSTIKYNTSTASRAAIYKNMSSVSVYQDAQIWMMNSQGQIIINTDSDSFDQRPVNVSGFDPTAWGTSYYRTGNFYGYFPADMLSVIAPVTANMNVKGYIAIHYPMHNLYVERENILAVIYIIYLILFLLSLLILGLFTVCVYQPLRKIIAGVDEYSSGHLDYDIPVHTNDEMGYLAASLNYMSNELNKTGEFQRKFVANVSHDFRSPLTSIKGYVEAIEDGTIPPQMQDKYLKIVIAETERLEKLTHSLLTLNSLDIKSRMMNMASFDINHVIKDVSASFEGTCRKKKITIQLILTGEQLFVYADMEQIQQVLYNLTDNAIKFSTDNSSIAIETTEKNGKIFVSVRDHGTGIPKESLPKIWDRFFKQDASRGKDRKGTGLGLSIVKEIINAHNQNINVISTIGVGTEFIFTLEQKEPV